MDESEGCSCFRPGHRPPSPIRSDFGTSASDPRCRWTQMLVELIRVKKRGQKKEEGAADGTAPTEPPATP
jgi:hypothetical protein